MTDTVIVKKEGAVDALAAGAVLSQALESGGDVLKTLLQASMTNPLMGAVVALWINDILYQQSIISESTRNNIGTMIFVAAGLSVTSELLADLTSILHVVGNQSNPSLFAPSASTIVLGNTGENAALLPLLSKLASK